MPSQARSVGELHELQTVCEQAGRGRGLETAPGSAMRGQARLAAITAGMSMLCVLGMAQKWDVSTISDEVLATPLPCSCLDLSLCRHPRRCVWVSTEGLEFVVSEIVLGS